MTATVPYPELRYNQVRQKASHNSYQRTEGIYDQVLYWRVRSLEFDLHRGNEGVWRVYHTWGEIPLSAVYTLEAAVRLCAGIQRALPQHEVITIFLEITNDGDFDATHTPEMLDRTIVDTLGRSNVFTPADLLGYNAGIRPANLQDAVTRGNWPRLVELRGRFIFVLNHSGRNGYEGPAGELANRRACFFADDGDDAGNIGRRNYIVFYNLAWGSKANGPQVFDRNLVGRLYPTHEWGGWTLSTHKQWNEAKDSRLHHLATNMINSLSDPWSRTDNIQGGPFEGITVPVDPGWREPGSILGLGVSSGSLEGSADSCFFAYDQYTPTSGDQTFTAFISCPGSHADSKALGGFMARESLAVGSPYFAVLRPAYKGKMRVQLRAVSEGATTWREVNLVPDKTVSEYYVAFVKLEIANQGTTARAWASLDGGEPWIPIAEQTFGHPLTLQGLAGCSGNGTDVKFLFGPMGGQTLPGFAERARVGQGVAAGILFQEVYPPRREIAAVISASGPLRDQKHRSSGDFNVQVLPKHTQFLNWRTDAETVAYDIRVDDSIGNDEVQFGGWLDNDSRTQANGARQLYIASPRNADRKFVVRVEAAGFYDSWNRPVPQGMSEYAAVVSRGKHESGETHRSSGNFNAELEPEGTEALCYGIVSAPGAGAITCDLWQDESNAPDVKRESGIENGLCGRASSRLVDARRLYVGDPRNTEDNQFLLRVFAVLQLPPGNPRLASIVSAPKPWSGQKHRSSGNFSTDTDEDLLKLYWEVTGNPNVAEIRFDVMEDTLFDPTIFPSLEHGAWTDARKIRKLYIANPKNAGEQDFTVTVYGLLRHQKL